MSTLLTPDKAAKYYGRTPQPLGHFGTGILNSPTDHETDCHGVARAQHGADVAAIANLYMRALRSGRRPDLDVDGSLVAGGRNRGLESALRTLGATDEQLASWEKEAGR